MYIKSQTFYIDPNSVNNSSRVFITSVDLYFKQKPNSINSSGSSAPGVTITICDTDSNGAPLYASGYTQSIATVSYANVIVSSNATAATTFVFNQPLPLLTGKTYSINIQADDYDYVLWKAKQGDAIIGTTNQPFPGFAGGNIGQLFDYATGGIITPIQNTQLKYGIRIAQFTSNTATYEIVNNGLEFFVTNRQQGSFQGGELAFPLLSNVSAQTVSFTTNSSTVLGTGTAFTSYFVNGSYIVAYTNATNFVVRQIASIANNTSLTVSEPIPYTNSAANFFKAPVGTVFHNDVSSNVVFLTNSTANSTLYFTNSTVFTATLTNGSNQYTSVSSVNNLFVGQPVFANIAGIQVGTTITAIGTNTVNVSTNFTGTTTASTNVYAQTPLIGSISNANTYLSTIFAFPVTQFQPEIGINTSKGGNSSLSYVFATTNATSFFVNTALTSTAINNSKTLLNSYNGVIASRSIEAAQSPKYLYGSNNKSAVFKIQLNQDSNTGGIFDSPYITNQKLDIFSSAVNINNDYTNENTSYGNALAKHITTKINFDPTYSAQDLLVQTTGFIPVGTSVIAYAKLYNSRDSDTFTLKQWTQLYQSIPAGASSPSSSIQSNNYVQLSFGLPNSPPSLYTANGTVTVSGSTVTGIGTNFANGSNAGEIFVNDVVKIWNPYSPSAYAVATVIAIANSTSLTLNTTIANTSITQPGFQIDKVSNPYTAFTNPQNNGVVRYYNSSLNEMDTYDTLQIKMILLSNNISVIPRLSSLTAVGLSS